MPKVRVELTRGCPHRFLRPARLPFRHFGQLQIRGIFTLAANILQTPRSQLPLQDLVGLNI